MALQKLQVVTTIGKNWSQPNLPKGNLQNQPPKPSALDRLYRSRPPKDSKVLKTLENLGITSSNQPKQADKSPTKSSPAKTAGLFGDLFGSSQPSSAQPKKTQCQGPR